ncbi:MAG: DUF6776 family protein [Corticimicrobacter sp.]|uniref:DUF6776 family protein n=1 Tax=Corticimicrobacter sp. TaxID=2678536 RepID=UPI0032DA8B72
MALFKKSQPVLFQSSYDSRRRGFRLPRWLILLLLGIIMGASGLLFLQKNYGAQRLTVVESQALTNELQVTKQSQQQLQGNLEQTSQALDDSQRSVQQLEQSLAQERQALEPLREDIRLFLEAMPADPRSSPVGVRAGRFLRQDQGLYYHVLLTNDSNLDTPFSGKLTLSVAGVYPSGRSETLMLEPVDVSFGQYEHVHGLAPLPEGFRPGRVTIQVSDTEGKAQGMRIINAR